jgi:hypothetical protein
MSEWISINDSIPKFDEPVLIFENGSMLIAELYESAEGTEWWGREYRWYPSHWMPLPEPPNLIEGK